MISAVLLNLLIVIVISNLLLVLGEEEAQRVGMRRG